MIIEKIVPNTQKDYWKEKIFLNILQIVLQLITIGLVMYQL